MHFSIVTELLSVANYFRTDIYFSKSPERANSVANTKVIFFYKMCRINMKLYLYPFHVLDFFIVAITCVSVRRDNLRALASGLSMNRRTNHALCH